MKLNLSLLFLGLIALASCSSDSEKKTGSVVVNQEVKQIAKPFSDLDRADTFKVVLSGTKPKDMMLKFSIISFEGKEIYVKNFQASELVDHYKETVDLKKEASQLSFIKEEFNGFLDEENFLEPAVTEAEEAGKQVPDKAFFEELKKSGLNGYQYRTGQENKVYIAWSAKEKRVKVYYNCC
jgi:hypothetical protein